MSVCVLVSVSNGKVVRLLSDIHAELTGASSVVRHACTGAHSGDEHPPADLRQDQKSGSQVVRIPISTWSDGI